LFKVRESPKGAIVFTRKEDFKCPVCGCVETELRGCCGNKRRYCVKCNFNGPRRIFIEGLPSKKKMKDNE